MHDEIVKNGFGQRRVYQEDNIELGPISEVCGLQVGPNECCNKPLSLLDIRKQGCHTEQQVSPTGCFHLSAQVAAYYES